MRKLLLAGALLLSFRAAAQTPDDQLWNMQGTWALGAHVASLDYSGSGSGIAYGARLDYFFSDYVSLRNRYLVGPNYFKVSLGPLFPLVINTGWIENGDNDIDGDSTVTCGESVKGPFGRAFLTSLLLIGADGVQGHIPIGNHITLSPFISPAELYFARVPGEKFKADGFTTLGCGLFAHSINGDFFAGVEGEYVRPIFWNNGNSGYRVNFTAGWCFE
jgi:hypothetical protein